MRRERELGRPGTMKATGGLLPEPASAAIERDFPLQRVLQEDGSFDPAEVKLEKPELLGLYRWMLLDRHLDERMITLQRQGRIGFYIGSVGEEATVLGSASGRWMRAKDEPLWMVIGAGCISVAAFSVGSAPWFWLVLVSLFVMGASDGLTIVAENGIMQRRTPDAVRSRTMAAFEALISLGLFFAYLVAIPMLRLLEPQRVYLIGAVGAGLATLLLLPLLFSRFAGEGDVSAQ